MLITATNQTTITTKQAMIFANIGKGLLGIAFFAMLAAAVIPDMRTSLRGTFLKDFRTIVSTARGDLLGNGMQLTVAKVRTRDTLLIEIYEPKEDGSQRLVERIEVPDKKDGYFNFNGQATNLVIDDIDGDGRPEILVPSFDANLIGHLNIYRYDQGAGVFQRSLR